jgi:CCR4-NOT transcriptional regulation complex NOT5 subunit
MFMKSIITEREKMDTLWDSISLRVGFDFITKVSHFLCLSLSLSLIYASSSSSSSESSSESSSSSSESCIAAAASNACHSSKV